MKKEEYDIIIAGAGPAGLSLAKELSPHFKTLVLDKEKIGHSYHTWYSYKDRIKKYNLQNTVLHECKQIEFRTIYNHHYMKDNCVIIDKDKILKKWLEQSSADVKKEKFFKYHNKKDHVSVSTNKGDYSAQLFIDTMGAFSPIIRSKNLIKHSLTWTCFGYTLTNIQPPPHIQFLPLNDKHNTYQMIYPTGHNSAHLVIFRNVDHNQDPRTILSHTFKRVLKKYYPQAKKQNLLYGNIPGGDLKNYALDRVFFWGDAGMYTPSAAGMGFNECLKEHKMVAKEIKSNLEKEQTSKKELNHLAHKVRKDIALNFQEIIAKIGFYNNTQKGWSQGVAWLNELGPPLSKYWMRNEIDLKWAQKALKKLYKVVSIKDLYFALPKKEYLFIMQESAKIVEDFTLQKIEEFFHKG